MVLPMVLPRRGASDLPQVCQRLDVAAANLVYLRNEPLPLEHQGGLESLARLTSLQTR